jgi:hypothetical protein
MWSMASIIDRVPPLLPTATGRSAPIPSSTTSGARPRQARRESNREDNHYEG